MDRPFNLHGGGGGGYFFPEFNIRLYDKNSESDFFFPPPKSEYFFQQLWESKYFLETPLDDEYNLFAECVR